jgi:uracil phosphoribosyltransferase
MLATGGTASMCIGLLREAGIPMKNITFVNLVSCPEGIDRIMKEHPDIQILTAAVDRELNG